MGNVTELMDGVMIERTLIRLSHNVLEKNEGAEGLAIIGIRTRGVYLAQRIAHLIEKAEGVSVPMGILDITFHRDDLSINDSLPEIKHSDIPFDVTGKHVILVDDVLYTGRTIRAAIETVMDFGRPKTIQLAVLIDRGHRELPIRGDYVGKNIPTSRDEKVQVLLSEADGQDKVLLYKGK